MPIPSSALISWQRVQECGDLPTARRRVRDHAGGFSATLPGRVSHARVVRDVARIWADSAHLRWSGLSLQCMTNSGEPGSETTRAMTRDSFEGQSP